PDFADPEAHDLDTPFGATLVTEGRWAGQTVQHVSRHGEGHARLSNHVNHRANVWALRELGADSVIACTACGALDPDQPLVSLTGGPETVLCGEAELPYALMGYATDYANGIAAEPAPAEEMIRLMGESTGTFAAVLRAALPRLAETELVPPGVVYRFES